MHLPPLAFLLPLCLINCSLKIKDPDACLLLLPLLLLFYSSFPVLDLVKGLAGMTVTTNFLSLPCHSEIVDGAVSWAPGLCWALGDATAESTVASLVPGARGSLESRRLALGGMDSR